MMFVINTGFVVDGIVAFLDKLQVSQDHTTLVMECVPPLEIGMKWSRWVADSVSLIGHPQ